MKIHRNVTRFDVSRFTDPHGDVKEWLVVSVNTDEASELELFSIDIERPRDATNAAQVICDFLTGVGVDRREVQFAKFFKPGGVELADSVSFEAEPEEQR